MTDPLASLRMELDRWAAAGLTVRVWLRDDDAIAATEALDSFLATLARHGAPVLIAAIPGRLEPSLAPRLAGLTSVAVGVHGHIHANHAAPGKKSAEYPAGRTRGLMLEELAQGRAIIEATFEEQAMAIFVPPWNRAYAGIAADLDRLGYRALSTFADAHEDEQRPGFVIANTHADLMHWRGSRGGRGLSAVADEVAAMLVRRRNDGPSQHPVGLLTHHLVHDETACATLDALLGFLGTHEAVRWLHPMDLIDEARPATR